MLLSGDFLLKSFGNKSGSESSAKQDVLITAGKEKEASPAPESAGNQDKAIKQQPENEKHIEP